MQIIKFLLPAIALAIGSVLAGPISQPGSVAGMVARDVTANETPSDPLADWFSTIDTNSLSTADVDKLVQLLSEEDATTSKRELVSKRGFLSAHLRCLMKKLIIPSTKC